MQFQPFGCIFSIGKTHQATLKDQIPPGCASVWLSPGSSGCPQWFGALIWDVGWAMSHPAVVAELFWIQAESIPFFQLLHPQQELSRHARNSFWRDFLKPGASKAGIFPAFGRISGDFSWGLCALAAAGSEAFLSYFMAYFLAKKWAAGRCNLQLTLAGQKLLKYCPKGGESQFGTLRGHRDSSHPSFPLLSCPSLMEEQLNPPFLLLAGFSHWEFRWPGGVWVTCLTSLDTGMEKKAVQREMQGGGQGCGVGRASSRCLLAAKCGVCSARLPKVGIPWENLALNPLSLAKIEEESAAHTAVGGLCSASVSCGNSPGKSAGETWDVPVTKWFLVVVFGRIELSCGELFLVCLFFTCMHLPSLCIPYLSHSSGILGLWFLTVGSHLCFFAAFCVLRAELEWNPVSFDMSEQKKKPCDVASTWYCHWERGWTSISLFLGLGRHRITSGHAVREITMVCPRLQWQGHYYSGLFSLQGAVRAENV